MNHFDFCIIGAGVIGAAIASKLRGRGSACVLERNEAPALETSGNNSGVIHPGFNHPPNSLKARLCLEGNALIYEYCGKNHISHRRAGTFVLAFNSEEEAALEILNKNAADLGVELHQKLPSVENPKLIAALFAPSGGVVDVQQLCKSLLNESFATLRCNTSVNNLFWDQNKWKIETSTGNVYSDFIINAAGLDSDVIAAMAGENQWQIVPCAGEYYEIQNWTSPHLFYRAIHSGPGLGIHLTPTLRGTTWIGPTATFLESKNDPRRFHTEEEFRNAAEEIYPGCTQHPVRIAHRGIRPKLSTSGFADFVIHRAKNPAIHLVGIESPGLTSSFAIARYVKQLL